MIPPTASLAVTMTAERWNQVLAILTEALAPHRMTDPLIRDIHAQCSRMAADLDEGAASGARPNVTQLHEAGC